MAPVMHHDDQEYSRVRRRNDVLHSSADEGVMFGRSGLFLLSKRGAGPTEVREPIFSRAQTLGSANSGGRAIIAGYRGRAEASPLQQ